MSLKNYFKTLGAAILGQVKNDLEKEIRSKVKEMEERIENLGYESARPQDRE